MHYTLTQPYYIWDPAYLKIKIHFPYFSDGDTRHYEEIEFKKSQARVAGQNLSNGEIISSNTLPRSG